MVIEELARRASVSFKPKRLDQALVANTHLSRAGWGLPGSDLQPVTLALSRRYMNESGVPIRRLLAAEKVNLDHLIVVHDELDLDLGRLRVKTGGGDNGHNGLRSIRAIVGSGDYFRVRIGVGRPSGRMSVTDWVLTDFRAAERDDLQAVVQAGADAVGSLIMDGLASTQQGFNQAAGLVH
jgi:PTH1 family peptidyl-tRNA hydrolase